ncbi:peptide ABC transporter substrate-binding protein [Loigolactobacillus backii]|uniref:tryptophan ABC transporter substrate-binding protein n=1 Tax=Loigolactobacillus backii TaxID=375175 RepID=UPI0007F0BC13|nr:tryptophan ABC transporter substrate-binding protein [Loigolactobacillus backii]ANK59027.1 peptide ABC transporter substrate-binding protein [Loigolactobacillus backii]ANK64015.1 peptide ABC transporter substrate-binding protein [Loigolactobacillus backii]ANK66464.1 peptide ABC transporter substrate-binding protein [Loigolactobacillus backii]OLF69850.1 peptide ABC transporter substrate-binding protein [Loigolactobacillus backii]PIO84007.1 peptide ABC transporter substrate-binding protein [L
MKRMIGLIAILVAFLGVAFFQEGGVKTTAPQEIKKPTIGILQTMSHPALDQITKGTIDQLKKRGYVNGKTAKIDFENAQGDQSNLKSMADRFDNEDTDLNIGIATPAAQSIANANKTTPLILGAISNPKSAGLVSNYKHPGGNITGVSNLTPTNDQIRLVREIMPNVKELGVMYTSGDPSAAAEVKVVRQVAPKYGFKLKEFTVSNSSDVDQVAQTMLQQVKAVYVPTDNTIATAMQTLVKDANNAHVPVFPPAGTMVHDGGLATYGINQYQLGVATGNMAADVLQGKAKPATTPIKIIAKGDLVLNMKEAKLLGINIPTHLVNEASKKGEIIR